MIGLLVSFLILSARKSWLAKSVSRILSGGKGLVRESRSFLLLKKTFDVLKHAYHDSSIKSALKILLKISKPLIVARKSILSLPLVSRINESLEDSKLMDKLLSPAAFLMMSLAFFAMAGINYSQKTLILIFLGLFSFLTGIFWGNLEYKQLCARINRRLILYSGLLMMVVGFTGFFLQIMRVLAIPIFNEAVRRRLSPIYNYMAWTSVPGTFYVISSLKKGGKRELSEELLILIVVGFVPTFFLGYRTEMLAYFLGVLAVLYYRRYISKLELLLWLTFGALLYMIASVVRLMFAGLTVNPIWAAAYRPTITAGFLEGIIMRYGWSEVTGGLIHLSGISSLFKFIPGPRYGPRTIIGIYAGGRKGISTTATIFAQFLLDFGIEGVIASMLLMGLLLSLAFNASKDEDVLLGPYATLLSYSLVGIETGILDFNVYLYLLLSATIVLASLRTRE